MSRRPCARCSAWTSRGPTRNARWRHPPWRAARRGWRKCCPPIGVQTARAPSPPPGGGGGAPPQQQQPPLPRSLRRRSPAQALTVVRLLAVLTGGVVSDVISDATLACGSSPSPASSASAIVASTSLRHSASPPPAARAPCPGGTAAAAAAGTAGIGPIAGLLAPELVLLLSLPLPSLLSPPSPRPPRGLAGGSRRATWTFIPLPRRTAARAMPV